VPTEEEKRKVGDDYAAAPWTFPPMYYSRRPKDPQPPQQPPPAKRPRVAASQPAMPVNVQVAPAVIAQPVPLPLNEDTIQADIENWSPENVGVENIFGLNQDAPVDNDDVNSFSQPLYPSPPDSQSTDGGFNLGGVQRWNLQHQG
jgi:hypothetical protein